MRLTGEIMLIFFLSNGLKQLNLKTFMILGKGFSLQHANSRVYTGSDQHVTHDVCYTCFVDTV